MRQSYKAKVETLVEALPFIRRFFGKTILVKTGGKVIGDTQAEAALIDDIVLLFYVGMKPILVHGGGTEITNFSAQLGLKPHFVKGLRVSDKETLKVAEMVLSGTINKRLVSAINQKGGSAVGLSGKDANLFQTKPLSKKKYQFVGRITEVRVRLLQDLVASGYIPVISSVGVDEKGQTYNVNADETAAAIAIAMKSAKTVLLTDVNGVYQTKKRDKIYAQMTAKQVKRFMQSTSCSQGMLPKLKAAHAIVTKAKSKVHLLNGLQPHALLMELFTEQGVGTMIVP